MTVLAPRELQVTAWPYVIAAPGLSWYTYLWTSARSTESSQTTLMLLSGLAVAAWLISAAALVYLWRAWSRGRPTRSNSLSLFTYAWITLLAGVGFLLLFGALQLTRSISLTSGLRHAPPEKKKPARRRPAGFEADSGGNQASQR